jgi:hypothetical protein
MNQRSRRHPRDRVSGAAIRFKRAWNLENALPLPAGIMVKSRPRHCRHAARDEREPMQEIRPGYRPSLIPYGQVGYQEPPGAIANAVIAR